MTTAFPCEFQRLDRKVHDRERFSCESGDLTNYLRRTARQDVEARACTCFVAVLPNDKSRIAGYYTLSSVSVHFTGVPPHLAKALPRYPQVPATLIGRLARDLEFKGRGVGDVLMIEALVQSVKAADSIGSALIVVDPKDSKSAAFYAKFGFEGLDEKRMFLSMNSAAQWLHQLGVSI
jgi:predicted GNAT family N-acyltransferase